jgi:hypothetical protein
MLAVQASSSKAGASAIRKGAASGITSAGALSSPSRGEAQVLLELPRPQVLADDHTDAGTHQPEDHEQQAKQVIAQGKGCTRGVRCAGGQGRTDEADGDAQSQLQQQGPHQ